MKRFIRNLLKKLPYLRQTLFLKGAITGHFYSPIPSIQHLRKHEREIFETVPRYVPGLDLNEQEQLQLVDRFRTYYTEQPFPPERSERFRYFFENGAFRYSDAIFLYCMMRLKRPKRIIEVGSGYSSCLMLDTNETDFQNSIRCTFIEPYPKLLLSLLKDTDSDRIELIGKPVEEVPLETFSRLSSGDFLFIDSTHVAKAGSDVNHIFTNILPALQPGVYVHFHDIFYPFEYPKEWIYDGKAWNEAYVLRAFLQFNDRFKIQLFPNFLMHFHEELFAKHMPLCLKDPGGSIWLRRVS